MNMVRLIDRVAAKGLQMKRKDKDLISDTGGSSHYRKDPKSKPPRSDVRKPFSTSKKHPGEFDKDVDRDEDLTS